MATDFYQAWSHRWLGVATLGWTDSSGTYSVSTSTTVAADRDFCHRSLASVTLDSRAGGTVNLGHSAFAPWLKAAMEAESARTFTITFSTTALTYTLTPDSGTLAITFTGDAGALMRRILGFTANKGAAASQMSDMRPWFVNRAQVDGRTNYDQPAVIDGQIRSAMGDDGSMYNTAPVRLVKGARWEHHYEPRAAVHRHFAVADTTVGGASWTWEDAIDHASRYAVPCVVSDSDGSMVFRTGQPFGRSQARLRQRVDVSQQTVAIGADAIVGYL